MTFKFDLAKLEEIFSKDFTSPVYNILADEYLKNNDIKRAYTVAKIGQEHHPNDVLGKYTLAKIHLLKNEITKSEQLLKEVLARFPLHLNARKLLIEILKKKEAESDCLAEHIEKLQEYFPNEGGPKKSENNTSAHLKNNEKLTEGIVDVEMESGSEKEPQSKIAIKKNMATFTLVDILISQKHFTGALEVLNILKAKGRSKDRINEKIAEIKEIMNR